MIKENRLVYLEGEVPDKPNFAKVEQSKIAVASSNEDFKKAQAGFEAKKDQLTRQKEYEQTQLNAMSDDELRQKYKVGDAEMLNAIKDPDTKDLYIKWTTGDNATRENRDFKDKVLLKLNISAENSDQLLYRQINEKFAEVKNKAMLEVAKVKRDQKVDELNKEYAAKIKAEQGKLIGPTAAVSQALKKAQDENTALEKQLSEYNGYMVRLRAEAYNAEKGQVSAQTASTRADLQKKETKFAALNAQYLDAQQGLANARVMYEKAQESFAKIKTELEGKRDSIVNSLNVLDDDQLTQAFNVSNDEMLAQINKNDPELKELYVKWTTAVESKDRATTEDREFKDKVISKLKISAENSDQLIYREINAKFAEIQRNALIEVAKGKIEENFKAQIEQKRLELVDPNKSKVADYEKSVVARLEKVRGLRETEAEQVKTDKIKLAKLEKKLQDLNELGGEEQKYDKDQGIQQKAEVLYAQKAEAAKEALAKKEPAKAQEEPRVADAPVYGPVYQEELKTAEASKSGATVKATLLKAAPKIKSATVEVDVKGEKFVNSKKVLTEEQLASMNPSQLGKRIKFLQESAKVSKFPYGSPIDEDLMPGITLEIVAANALKNKKLGEKGKTGVA